MSNFKYISSGQNQYRQASAYEFQVAMLSKRSDDLYWHNVAQVESDRRGRKQVHFSYVDLDQCVEGNVYRSTRGRVFGSFYIFRDGEMVEISREEGERLADLHVANRLTERRAANEERAAKEATYAAIDTKEPTPLHDRCHAAGRNARPAATIDGDAWSSHVQSEGAKAELAQQLKAAHPAQWAREEQIIQKRMNDAIERERRFQENHDL